MIVKPLLIMIVKPLLIMIVKTLLIMIVKPLLIMIVKPLQTAWYQSGQVLGCLQLSQYVFQILSKLIEI